MKNPLLNNSVLLNVTILLLSAIISFFTLLFGFAHLIEGITQNIKGTSPDIPKGEAILGGIIVMFLCITGIGALALVIMAFVAIFKKVKKS